MQAEANKALVRRFFEEVYNRNNLAICDEIQDAEYAAFEKAWVPAWRSAFPDMRMTVDDLIAEGDKVVAVITFRGTHTGVLDGEPVRGLTARLAPTGRAVEIKGVFIYRIADGRLLRGEYGGTADWLGLLRQLGAVPTPAEAAA